MGRKTITIILGVLFVIFLSAGIVGLLNKDKNNPSIDKTEKTANLIKLSANNIEVEDLQSRINEFDLTMANREVIKDGFSVSIEDGKAVIVINLGEETQESKRIEITEVSSVEAIHAEEDDNGFYIYIMDSNKNLYRSLVNSENNNVTTLKYELSNIVSFISFYGAFTSEIVAPYVIIKTADENYYTDYKISENEELSIKKLVDNNQNGNELEQQATTEEIAENPNEEQNAIQPEQEQGNVKTEQNTIQPEPEKREVETIESSTQAEQITDGTNENGEESTQEESTNEENENTLEPEQEDNGV